MKAEEQKYRLIVAIAAMFDNVCRFMAAYIVAKILQAGAQDAVKSVLTHEIRRTEEGKVCR